MTEATMVWVGRGRKIIFIVQSVARVKPFSTTGTEDNERKIYSVLSSSAKSSEEADRKVSKVKCQCSTHMIIGRIVKQ